MPEEMKQLAEGMSNFEGLPLMNQRDQAALPPAPQDPSVHKHAQARTNQCLNNHTLYAVALMLSSSVFADQREPGQVQYIRGGETWEASHPLERCANELRKHR